MFDRLAADVTADLWHPEIRRPQCASPALRPFLWSCNLRNFFPGLNNGYRMKLCGASRCEILSAAGEARFVCEDQLRDNQNEMSCRVGDGYNAPLKRTH